MEYSNRSVSRKDAATIACLDAYQSFTALGTLTELRTDFRGGSKQVPVGASFQSLCVRFPADGAGYRRRHVGRHLAEQHRQFAVHQPAPCPDNPPVTCPIQNVMSTVRPPCRSCRRETAPTPQWESLADAHDLNRSGWLRFQSPPRLIWACTGRALPWSGRGCPAHGRRHTRLPSAADHESADQMDDKTPELLGRDSQAPSE